MATITKAQVQKINNSCSNDWQLDLEYLIHHGEKQLVKHCQSLLKNTTISRAKNTIIFYD